MGTSDDMDGPATLAAGGRSLADAVAELAHQRRAYHAESTALEVAQQAFTAQYEGLIRRVNDLNSQCGAMEKRVRAIAEMAFRATGEKHPHPAVEIKISKVVAYETAAALAWAIEKGMCLKLDNKALEALAKASPASLTGICIVVDEPHAQIARDLSSLEDA